MGITVIATLDIGGTKLSSALFDGTNLLERQQIPTPPDRSPEHLLNTCLELLRPHLPHAQALRVAATGFVRQNGIVRAVGNDILHGWSNGVNVAGWLENATQLETKVLNDADAAAWGEFKLGAGRGCQHFAFVTVSTGIGGGLVLNSQLYTTPHGLHAEFGNILTDSGTPLEHLASGTALDLAAREHGWTDAREVVARAGKTEELAVILLEDSALRVARLLGNLRVLLGIEKVAVGGGLGLASGYLERLQADVQKFGAPWSGLEVVRAELGADAGLIGAAL
jgi:N-acylmannosamine kinase